MSDRIGAVLLIDNRTGRAHALCDLFLRTDPDVRVHYGPGHPAIRHPRLVHEPDISLTDVGTVIAFCRRTQVDFVFVSWINSLSAGYVDALRAAGIRVIGPVRRGAELEASKRRGKEFCVAHGIPTAAHAGFADPAAALAHVRAARGPMVVKEDGLTDVSDGVRLCSTAAEAADAIAAIERRMGPDFAVVVEERLDGQDVSVLALVDGKNHLMLPAALDYKRALDHDEGINCDGMGTVAPHPGLDAGLAAEADAIVAAIVRGLAAEGIHYTGFLYVGCMITPDGLTVLEINTRLGDSEAQAVLPAVRANFTEVCEAVLAGRLSEMDLRTDRLARCVVVATQGCLDPEAAGGKPGWPFGAYETRLPIHGLDTLDPTLAKVYFAGVDLDADERHVTAGGRVLHVVGAAATLEEATRNAYGELSRISFAGLRYRTDIGSLGVPAPAGGRR